MTICIDDGRPETRVENVRLPVGPVSALQCQTSGWHEKAASRFCANTRGFIHLALEVYKSAARATAAPGIPGGFAATTTTRLASKGTYSLVPEYRPSTSLRRLRSRRAEQRVHLAERDRRVDRQVLLRRPTDCLGRSLRRRRPLVSCGAPGMAIDSSTF